MEKGIAIAGTITADYYKIIDRYAEKGMLSNILRVDRGVGGCVTNTIVNLAKIDPSIPLYAFGGIGNDENGDYIIRVLKENGVNYEGIKRFEGELTAFTDAMIIETTGERTFFTAKGANKVFSYDDINFESIQTDIFHMGYALLMDPFDQEDKEYGTVMARTLARIQAKGIKTSIDLVSVDDERFTKIVLPSLPYCNYFIVNEIEAGKTAGISPYDSNGEIKKDRIRRIAEKVFEAGVKDLVVIHAPQGGWAMTSGGEFKHVPSLKLPNGYIKGSVGAGDAFCAGMLYSIYRGLSLVEALENANAAAACSLGEIDSTSGMKNIAELRRFYDEYKR